MYSRPTVGTHSVLRAAIGVVVGAALLAAGVNALPSAGADQAGTGDLGRVVARGRDAVERSFLPPPPRSGRGVQATIHVSFTVYFPPAAQAAVRRAADILAGEFGGGHQFTVWASWHEQEPGALAWARPAQTGCRSDTCYPSARARGLGLSRGGAGRDLDIDVNAAADWYLGTDGQAGRQFDLVTVALHELAHGIGVTSKVQATGWAGTPHVYDRNVVTGAGEGRVWASSRWLTSNDLYWSGPRAVAANDGVRPRLYAPGTWAQGTSYVHLDEATYPTGDPNSLMTPFFSRGEAVHDVGPILRGMMFDMGWNGVPRPDTTFSTITTVAGGGASRADGAMATQTKMFVPWHVAVGPDGSLYFADSEDHRVRRVAPDGTVWTVAGTGAPGTGGAGGPATAAQLDRPTHLSVAPDGTVFIEDIWSLVRVSPSGRLSRLTTLSPLITHRNPTVGADGTFYFIEEGFIGSSSVRSYSIQRVGSDGIARLLGSPRVRPRDMTVRPDGSIVFSSENEYGGVVYLLRADGVISQVAGGGFGSDGGPALEARLSSPSGGLAVDRDGNLFIGFGRTIRRVAPDGIISTVAGREIDLGGFGGDGGSPLTAQVGGHTGLATDAEGNLFIAQHLADQGTWREGRIRKLTRAMAIPTRTATGTPTPTPTGTVTPPSIPTRTATPSPTASVTRTRSPRPPTVLPVAPGALPRGIATPNAAAGGRVVLLPTAVTSASAVAVLQVGEGAPFEITLVLPVPPAGATPVGVRLQPATLVDAGVALPSGATVAKVVAIDVFDASTGAPVHEHAQPLELSVPLTADELAVCASDPARVALLHIGADGAVTRLAPANADYCQSGVMQAWLSRTSSYAIAMLRSPLDITIRVFVPISVRAGA